MSSVFVDAGSLALRRSGALMAKPFRTMSLRTRIVLLVVALFIAGIWGFAVRVTASLQSDIEKLISEQLSSTVGFVASDIDSNFQARITALNQIAASISPEMLNDAEKLQSLLEQPSIVGAGTRMDFLVVNKAGLVVADYPRIPGRTGRSVADRPHFREAMTSGNIVIGAPRMGHLARQRRLVSIVVPLRDASGSAAGVIIDPVALSDPDMFGQLEQTKIGQTGYFLVMSTKDHLIVSATDQNRIMTPLPAQGVNPLLDRRLYEGFDGAGITISSLGTKVLTVSRQMATSGWILLGAVPTEEIFAPIATFKRDVYLAAILISLLAAVVLRNVLTRHFARLEQAGQAMRRMSAGEQSLIAIPVTRKDEIGKLIGEFNRLAEERNRLDEERNKASEALEEAMRRLHALSARTTLTQEEVRRAIALELHESSAQDLTAVKIQMEMLRPYCLAREAEPRLRDALMMLRSMQERIRNMALELYSPALNDLGLVATLRVHCRRQADAAGWELHFDAPEGGERPHRDIEIACFRVVEEALTNIACHADATEVWVNLRKSANELHLSLRDNGAGFVTSEISAGKPDQNLGLFGMVERTRQVGGRLNIKSSPGSGTEILAAFPLLYDPAHPRNLSEPVLARVFSPDARFDLPAAWGASLPREHDGNRLGLA